MDEEEFYRQSKDLPPRQPTYTPFGYAPALANSNRKWAKWFARFILLSPFITILGLFLLSLLMPNNEANPYKDNENGNLKFEQGNFNGALDEYT